MQRLANAKQALKFISTRVPPQVSRVFGDLIEDAERGWQTNTDDTFRTIPGGAAGSSAYGPFPTYGQGGLTVPQAPYFYNYNTSFLVPFAIANVSTLMLPNNSKRTMLVIQNLSGSADLYFNIGGGAAVNNGILLVAGAGFVFDSVCPADSVSVFFDNATKEAGVILEVRFTPNT